MDGLHVKIELVVEINFIRDVDVDVDIDSFIRDIDVPYCWNYHHDTMLVIISRLSCDWSLVLLSYSLVFYCNVALYMWLYAMFSTYILL